MYYSIAGQRVAMYDGTDLVYFLTDHLGSTVGVLDDTGTDINILLEENRYTPFGEVRDITGSLDPITETDFGFTGQRDLGGIGLMDYNARFYSPTLGRFVQPDSIVPNPGNPQSLNRYSYVINNPMVFMDPSGHVPTGEFDDTPCLPNSDCYPDPIPWNGGGNGNGEQSLQFETSPVNYDDIVLGGWTEDYWIQWFGGTQFAQFQGSDWNYDAYCKGMHCGFDLGAPYGTPVVAGVNGIVFDVTGGGLIITSGDYSIYYQNLMEIPEYLRNGVEVTPNTFIGVVGNHAQDPAGGNNHIHLEIWVTERGVDGKIEKITYHNPLKFMKEDDINIFASIAILQLSDPMSVQSALFAEGYSPLVPSEIEFGPGTLQVPYEP